MLAAVTITGLLIGLLLAVLVGWVLRAIGAPDVLAVLVALLVLILCLTSGVNLR